MSADEDQLTVWAKPPSETEEDKCRNAVDRITKAITSKFGSSVSIFLQGSYKNRTNVKKDSDVDIVVRHNDYYFPDVFFLSDNDKKTYWNNFIVSEYTFPRFKNDIQQVLENEFDEGEVERKDKCIKIWGDEQRVNADVVPCFVHKRMKTPYTVDTEGIELKTDGGIRIYSFPQQHFDNGAKKNNDTETFYKSVVRILKNVRNNLVDQGTILDKAMPSFFLECLVWNVPDQNFAKNTFMEATKSIVYTVWNDMGDTSRAQDYTEVSNLKWLFRGNDGRTPLQAKNFMAQAWAYTGFT